MTPDEWADMSRWLMDVAALHYVPVGSSEWGEKMIKALHFQSLSLAAARQAFRETDRKIDANNTKEEARAVSVPRWKLALRRLRIPV